MRRISGRVTIGVGGASQAGSSIRDLILIKLGLSSREGNKCTTLLEGSARHIGRAYRKPTAREVDS